MYTEQAIKRAKEVGFRVGERHVHVGISQFDVHHCTEAILFDPLFWQALGKSLGWKVASGSDMNHQWTFEWHNFTQHLIMGKDIESFFKQLLASETK
jgi:hypothetical protein